MNELPQHEMQLQATYPSGAEEWSCPMCGRRFVMHGLPGYERLTLERGERHVLAWGRTIGATVATKIVLDPGDADAFHTGSKSGPRAFSPELVPLEEDELLAKLSAWPEWLEDVDFGDEGSEHTGSPV